MSVENIDDLTKDQIRAAEVRHSDLSDDQSKAEASKDTSKGRAAMYSHLGDLVDTSMQVHHEAKLGDEYSTDDDDSDDSNVGCLGGKDASSKPSKSKDDDGLKKIAFPANAALALILAGDQNAKAGNLVLEKEGDLTGIMSTIGSNILKGEQAFEKNFAEHGKIDPTTGEPSISMGYQELTGKLYAKGGQWWLKITVDGKDEDIQISRGGDKLLPPTDSKDVPSYLKKHGLAYPDGKIYPGDAGWDQTNEFKKYIAGGKKDPVDFKVEWTDGSKVPAGGGIAAETDESKRNLMLQKATAIQQQGQIVTDGQQGLMSGMATNSSQMTTSINQAQSGQQSVLQAVSSMANLTSSWRNL